MYCTKIRMRAFKCNQQTAERLTSVDLKRCGQQKVQALVNWFNPIIRGTVYLCFIYLRPWLSRPDHAWLCTRSLNRSFAVTCVSFLSSFFVCGCVCVCVCVCAAIAQAPSTSSWKWALVLLRDTDEWIFIRKSGVGTAAAWKLFPVEFVSFSLDHLLWLALVSQSLNL